MFYHHICWNYDLYLNGKNKRKYCLMPKRIEFWCTDLKWQRIHQIPKGFFFVVVYLYLLCKTILFLVYSYLLSSFSHWNITWWFLLDEGKLFATRTLFAGETICKLCLPCDTQKWRYCFRTQINAICNCNASLFLICILWCLIASHFSLQ